MENGGASLVVERVITGAGRIKISKFFHLFKKLVDFEEICSRTLSVNFKTK